MSKHTPGPWGIDGDGWDKKIMAAERAVTGAGFASLEDARLIAAAPELLEACEYALETSDRTTTREVLREAIKKAKGEE